MAKPYAPQELPTMAKLSLIINTHRHRLQGDPAYTVAAYDADDDVIASLNHYDTTVVCHRGSTRAKASPEVTQAMMRLRDKHFPQGAVKIARHDVLAERTARFNEQLAAYIKALRSHDPTKQPPDPPSYDSSLHVRRVLYQPRPQQLTMPTEPKPKKPKRVVKASPVVIEKCDSTIDVNTWGKEPVEIQSELQVTYRGNWYHVKARLGRRDTHWNTYSYGNLPASGEDQLDKTLAATDPAVWLGAPLATVWRLWDNFLEADRRKIISARIKAAEEMLQDKDVHYSTSNYSRTSLRLLERYVADLA